MFSCFFFNFFFFLLLKHSERNREEKQNNKKKIKIIRFNFRELMGNFAMKFVSFLNCQ